MDTYIVNEYPLVSELENPFRTHFGVIPEYSHVADQEIPVIQFDFNLDGSDRRHDDPSQESLLWRGPGVTAWVSGSWKCWGPQDQDTEGDKSLHVAVYTPEMPSKALLEGIWESLYMDVDDGCGVLVNHALVTRRADSEVSHIVLFHDGEATIYPVAQEAENDVYESTSWKGADEFIFSSEKEAKLVLSELRYRVAHTGSASVSYFKDLVVTVTPGRFADPQWGWRTLAGVRVLPYRDGLYWIDLHRPERLA